MRKLLWVCLMMASLTTVDLSMVTTVHAQSRDSPSHRLIPRDRTAKAPTPQDFMTPELLELIDDYHQLSRAQRQEARGRAESTQQPNLLRSDPFEQGLGTAERDLLQRLDQRTFDSQLDDINDDISSLSDQLAEQLGGELAETMKPAELSPDTEQPLQMWDQIQKLRETIQDQHRELQNQYREALRQYQDSWPSDNIPPDEWLKKVQPLLNPELSNQMQEVIKATRARAEAARNKGGSKTPELAGSQSSETSSTAAGVSEALKSGSSKKLLDSVISTLDKRGMDWIKQARKDPRKNSAMKKAAEKASNWLTSLNLKATENSNEIAIRRAVSPANPASSGSGGMTRLGTDQNANLQADGKNFGMMFGLLSALLAVVLGVYLFRDRLLGFQSADRIPRKVTVGTIQDRASLLRACHMLALRCFGWPSRFWHHREVFSRLGAQGDDQSVQTVRRLEAIYERARYAPDGELTPEQVDHARRLFSEIRDLPAAV